MNIELIIVGIVLAAIGGRIGWLLACRKVLEETRAVAETLADSQIAIAEYEKIVNKEREEVAALVDRLLAEVNRLQDIVNQQLVATK